FRDCSSPLHRQASPRVQMKSWLAHSSLQRRRRRGTDVRDRFRSDGSGDGEEAIQLPIVHLLGRPIVHLIISRGVSPITFVAKLGFVLAVLGFDAAVAHEGYLGHDHDKWHHGFYKTLERPDTKSPCCNLTDCRPTSGRQVDGHYEVKVNGAWVSVP